MKRYALITALLAGLILLPANARALTIIGHYTNGGATAFDIATYSVKPGKAKCSLLGIAGSARVSITFTQDEWQTFVALWRKAEGTRSASFQFIGTYKETGTDYLSLLTVAAGPGVQFSINDKAGTFNFVLSPDDFARFDADVAKVSAFFNSN